ncbi:hypothetical protein COO60DRAFT_1532551 [Scenedesmus sp. NREL 46B-D3]|nr:hypothetical protein COO60DRAFT_1532551 [Scenedesmus sp. NREL 46B-D3]
MLNHLHCHVLACPAALVHAPKAACTDHHAQLDVCVLQRAQRCSGAAVGHVPAARVEQGRGRRRRCVSARRRRALLRVAASLQHVLAARCLLPGSARLPPTVTPPQQRCRYSRNDSSCWHRNHHRYQRAAVLLAVACLLCQQLVDEVVHARVWALHHQAVAAQDVGADPGGVAHKQCVAPHAAQCLLEGGRHVIHKVLQQHHVGVVHAPEGHVDHVQQLLLGALPR